jgi:S-adenosylhomocysteine hydrolase
MNTLELWFLVTGDPAQVVGPVVTVLCVQEMVKHDQTLKGVEASTLMKIHFNTIVLIATLKQVGVHKAR